MNSIPPPAFLAALILIATSLTGCAGASATGSPKPATQYGPMPGGGRGMMMGPRMGYGGGMMMGASMQRHRRAMMDGIPAPYRDLRNPLPADSRVVSEGRALYQASCAACHGERGEGDGPAAAGLSPPPANLPWVMDRPMAGDGYLMWTISEGGVPLGSAMPAYKDVLGEPERWKIIRFLRTL